MNITNRTSVVLLAVLCGACSGSTSASRPTATPSSATNTKLDSGAELLTRANLQSIGGLGRVKTRDFRGVEVSENPDPRGPCGGQVPQPSYRGSIGRTFTTTNRAIVQLLLPRTIDQRFYMDAIRADVRTPCPPYESKTNTGTVQRVDDIHMVNLDRLDARAVAWTSVVTLGEEETFGGAVAIETSENVVLLQFVGKRLADAAIEEMAKLAVERAAG